MKALFALGLGCALLSACSQDAPDQKMAGTSVGTGNPTEIKLSFTKDGLETPVSGRLEIFLADQNPVFDSLPFAAFAVSEEAGRLLVGGDLADSLEKKIARGGKALPGQNPAALTVNAFFRASTGLEGGITLSLVLDTGKNGASAPGRDEAAKSALRVGPLLRARGQVGSSVAEADEAHVFVPGSPFKSLVDTGRFEIAGIPQGEFPLALSVTVRSETDSLHQISLSKLDRKLNPEKEEVFFPVTD